MSFYNRQIKTNFQNLHQIEEEIKLNEESFSCKEIVNSIINAQGFYIFMVLLTVYSIFAVDLEKLFLTASFAIYFGVAHIFAILIFTMEMIFNGIAKSDYLFGFFFWIDLFSNLSMVLEIGWIDDYLSTNTNIPVVLTFAKIIKAGRLTKVGGRVVKMIGLFLEIIQNYRNRQKNQQKESAFQQKTNSLEQQNSSKEEKANRFQQIVPDLQNGQEYTGFNKVGKQKLNLQMGSDEQLHLSSNAIQDKSKRKITYSNLQRRIAKEQSIHILKKHQQSNYIVDRLEKFIILPHLVRKNVDCALEEQIQEKFINIYQNKKETELNIKDKLKVSQQNFKLGEALKQNIQKNTIIMIMSLIMILPILDSSTWIDTDPTIDLMVNPYLKQVLDESDPIVAKKILDNFISFSLMMTTPLIYLQARINATCCTFPGPHFENFIAAEQVNNLAEALLTRVQTDKYSLIFSNHGQSRIQSELNIIRSIYIVILLVFSSIIFMKGIQKHALQPLEQMCISINNISINPFDALKEVQSQIPTSPVKLQTEILEKAIIKMTRLLAVGAGQFGSKMITSDQGTSCNKLIGIFMHLRIPSTRDLPFLNKISQIIVENCIIYGGVPIENNQNQHMLFWKFDSHNLVLQSNKSFSFTKEHNETINVFALVLYALLEMHLQLYANEQMIANEEKSLGRFVLEAGLHYGPCLEGAIGSPYKQQTKLIGEDVLFTQKLSKLSSVYQVRAVLSESFFLLLPQNQNYHVRKIDYVLEQANQFSIYSYDFDEIKQPKLKREKKMTEKQVYAKRNDILEKMMTQSIHKALPENKFHFDMTRRYDEEFYENWNEAIELYFNQRFDQAASIFENIEENYSKDGPVSILLSRIKLFKNDRPKNWEKYVKINLQ